MNMKTEKDLLIEVDHLKKQLEKIKDKKKYGLVWDAEREPEEVVLDCRKKLPILMEKEKKKIIDKKYDQTNLLIEGDNYHSLSVLNYTHKEKVDFVYIDPPYNTGAKDWKYNNDYVDENDLWRHSKWVSFMEKRINLSRSILKKDGVICCTIDDYEIFSLLGIFESLNANIIGVVTIVNKAEGRNQKKYFTGGIEYAVFATWGNPKMRGLLLEGDNICESCGKKINGKKSKEISEDGREFEWVGFHRRNPIDDPTSSNRWYPIYVSKKGEISVNKTKDSIEVFPINNKGENKIWGWKKERLAEYLKENPDDFKAKKYSQNGEEKITILYKRYGEDRVKPKSYWIGSKYNAYSYGTKLIKEILQTKETKFEFPKSLYAVIDCIDLFLPKDGLVLDYFAGSGTTGHAVLYLNKKDQGSRKFILCTNNENKICEEVTYERIKNVIKGYGTVKGLGGNLRYYKTDFVETENLDNATDQDKIELTYKAGEMIAIREDTFDEVEKNDWWQIFSNGKEATAIYFKEDKSKLQKLVDKLDKMNKKVNLYIFSWGKNEYTNEFPE